MSLCRSCKAEIRFVRTESGRWMPLDSEPVSDGNVMVVDNIARVLSEEELKNPDGSRVQMAEPLYSSHFRTCPGAAKHRKGTA